MDLIGHKKYFVVKMVVVNNNVSNFKKSDFTSASARKSDFTRLPLGSLTSRGFR